MLIIMKKLLRLIWNTEGKGPLELYPLFMQIIEKYTYRTKMDIWIGVIHTYVEYK